MKKSFVFILAGSIVLSVIFNNCNDDEEVTPDPDKVECVITQPAANDTSQVGKSISINVEASYNNGSITKVRFYVDNKEIGSSSSSPYVYEWNTSGFTSGQHTIKALAETNNGKNASDEINLLLIGDVTVAAAGQDTAVYDGSTTITLYANDPKFDYETGEWIIIEGDGGSFTDISKANTEFSGELQTIYTLVWTISTVYESSSDTIQVMFNSVTDIEGNVYRTTKIGDQWWMADNLKVTKFPDGTNIPLITDNTEWAELEDNNEDKAYSWYDNNKDFAIARNYGALYTYAAATNGDNSGYNVQGICPDGWHLPSKSEWDELESFVKNDGYDGEEATALKSITDWFPNNGIDIYDFSALPAGFRFQDNRGFSSVTGHGAWWTSSEGADSTKAFHKAMDAYYKTIFAYGDVKSYGFSIRCIKD